MLFVPHLVTVMEKRRILIVLNLIVAAVYLGGAGVVALRALSGQTSVGGSAVLVVLFVAQAFGHARIKRWALMISAALAAVANLFAIPYLFAAFEAGLLPSMRERLLTFFLLTMLTIIMVLNYSFYSKVMRASMT